MAYRLRCSGCGRTVTADQAAIRRELAVCPDCNAILQVTCEGDRQERETILHRRMPEAVAVERHSPRNLSIRAKRDRAAWTLNRRTFLFAWAGGLGVGACLALSVGPGYGLLGILAGLACFAAAAKFQREHPPLELRGGYLIPSPKSQGPLAVTDVQQIYSALCHVGLGGDTSYSTANVFALTHKGERVLLLGPLQSEQDALYIEQVLESEFQLFDLPVFEATPGSGASSTPRAQTEPFRCEGCNARFSNEETRDTQMLECLRCGALSLLIDPTDEMDFLKDSESELRSFDINEEVDGLSIAANHGRGSIEILGDRVVLRYTGSAPLTVSGRQLERIFVKPSKEPDDGCFRVIARHSVQGEIELTGGVPEARQAFRIVRTLTRVLAKSA